MSPRARHQCKSLRKQVIRVRVGGRSLRPKPPAGAVQAEAPQHAPAPLLELGRRAGVHELAQPGPDGQLSFEG